MIDTGIPSTFVKQNGLLYKMVPPARGRQRDSCRSGICQRGGVAVKHAMVATATHPRTVDTNGWGEGGGLPTRLQSGSRGHRHDRCLFVAVGIASVGPSGLPRFAVYFPDAPFCQFVVSAFAFHCFCSLQFRFISTRLIDFVD